MKSERLLPQVDVVIPVYNGAKWIARAVNSALAQTGVEVRVHVVDDGSHDESLGVAQGLAQGEPRINVIAAAHAGLSASRNRGIAAGSAPWIALLDCDDLWNQSKSARQIATCHAGETDWCVCSAKLVDDAGRPLGILDAPSSLSASTLLAENIVPSPSGVIFRRSLFERAGGFDEALVSAEDWDMWIRLACIAPGSPVALQLVEYTVHAHNMSKDVSRMARGTSDVLKKHRSLYSASAYRRAVARNHVRLGTEAVAASHVGEAFGHAVHGLAVMPPARGTLKLLRWCVTRAIRGGGLRG